MSEEILNLEKRAILSFAEVFADDESQVLLKKLAGPHSPISVRDLPWENSGSKITNLNKLYELENLGLIEVKSIELNGSQIKQFHVTPLGSKVCKKFL